MFKFDWKRLGLAAGLSLSLVAAGCGGGGSSDEGTTDGSSNGGSEGGAVGEGQEVELAYVEWDTEVASTHVVGKVLEDLGYEVTTTPLDNAVMWEAVANGEADGMVAAWLPLTHEAQFEEYGDQVEHLGTNLEGAKTGLVVPSYMDVNSIADLDSQADMTITGIEPGAGVVAATEAAMESYDNLADWELQTSSSGAMTTALGEAIENEEEIVVTGWSPHWKFQTYDVKYLEDPEGGFGEAETIDTMVRQGLEEDMPNVYSVLDNFYWETSSMEEVMVAIQEGASPEDAAATWVEENQDVVSEWTADVEQ
ncbi:glycine betaine ABC transporter substrate-binding protein [Lentibacillus sediminis]|uniref:glycine betaine ABC transporter substrate-binding protein n=1 Tax=Lentibacillus sediminis TaxID=1940529 RepID=UPI000C1BB3E4|nr:glycine betaine ABC transporter substrate-binding protein [Lentibacillus sediminis]